jgi:hypothetical protein
LILLSAFEIFETLIKGTLEMVTLLCYNTLLITCIRASFDGGVVNHARLSDWQPFGISSGVRNATSISSVSSIPTVALNCYNSEMFLQLHKLLLEEFVETMSLVRY